MHWHRSKRRIFVSEINLQHVIELQVGEELTLHELPTHRRLGGAHQGPQGQPGNHQV